MQRIYHSLPLNHITYGLQIEKLEIEGEHVQNACNFTQKVLPRRQRTVTGVGCVLTFAEELITAASMSTPLFEWCPNQCSACRRRLFTDYVINTIYNINS